MPGGHRAVGRAERAGEHQLDPAAQGRIADSSDSIASTRKTCERVRMSRPGQVPPSTRRLRRVRRTSSPRSVCIDPVWTMRKTPGTRGDGSAPKSSGSKPIGIPATGRSSQLRHRAAQRAWRPRARPSRPPTRSIARGACGACRALGEPRSGAARISSSAHGSSRSATQGLPSSRATRIPANAVSYGAHAVSTTSASAATRSASLTLSSTHQRTQASARPPAARQTSSQSGGTLGLGPGYAMYRHAARHSIEQLEVVGVPAPALVARPGHDDDVVAVLRQVAHRSDRSVHARPTDRREVPCENEYAGHCPKS